MAYACVSVNMQQDIATSGKRDLPTAVSSVITYTGDVIVIWDASKVTTKNQLRSALRQANLMLLSDDSIPG